MLRATNVGTELSSKIATDSEADELVERICSGGELDQRRKGMLRQYVIDLRFLLKECYRVLVSKGKGIFVVGDCNLRDTYILNSQAIKSLGQKVGFKIERVRRRPLPENRRYLPPPEIKASGKALQKRMREEIILTVVKPG